MLIALLGCQLLPPFVPPELPAEMQFVLDSPETFVLPEDVAPDPAAEPVQDASALAGCWARTFEPEDVDLSADDTGLPVAGDTQARLRTIELWRFDAASGDVQCELYVGDETSGVVLLQIMSGTFEVREPGIVIFRFKDYISNDWATGQMSSVVPEGDEEPSEGVVRFERSSERLFLTGSGATPESIQEVKPADALQHFPCS
jgi:hypothetical protein